MTPRGFHARRFASLSLSRTRAANRCSRYDSDETIRMRRRRRRWRRGERILPPSFHISREEGGCLICPVNNRKEDATPHLHLHHKRATVFRAYSRISLDLVAASSVKKEASLAEDRRPRISPRFFLLLEKKKKKEFKEEREKERGEKRWVEVGNPCSRR